VSQVSWYAVAAGCSQVRKLPPPFAGERPCSIGVEQRVHGEGASARRMGSGPHTPTRMGSGDGFGAHPKSGALVGA
jgi:hypothetical protein